jgi:hypothetical protein
MTQNPFSAAPTAPADADQLTSRSRRHRQNPNFSNLLKGALAAGDMRQSLLRMRQNDVEMVYRSGGRLWRAGSVADRMMLSSKPFSLTAIGATACDDAAFSAGTGPEI